MPSRFEYQHTDRENAKAPPKSVARDNDLRSSSAGSVPSIAGRSQLGQQHITGSGGNVVTAKIK